MEAERELSSVPGKGKPQRVVASIKIPKFSSLSQVLDLPGSAIVTEGVLYFPRNQQEELIDAIGRMGRTYYALQFTIAKQHDAEQAKILRLSRALKLAGDDKLLLIYVIPYWGETDLKNFNLIPVHPLENRTGVSKPDVQLLARTVVHVAGISPS